jgi:hypothetical protein
MGPHIDFSPNQNHLRLFAWDPLFYAISLQSHHTHTRNTDMININYTNALPSLIPLPNKKRKLKQEIDRTFP